MHFPSHRARSLPLLTNTPAPAVLWKTIRCAWWFQFLSPLQGLTRLLHIPSDEAPVPMVGPGVRVLLLFLPLHSVCSLYSLDTSTPSDTRFANNVYLASGLSFHDLTAFPKPDVFPYPKIQLANLPCAALLLVSYSGNPCLTAGPKTAPLLSSRSPRRRLPT